MEVTYPAESAQCALRIFSIVLRRNIIVLVVFHYVTNRYRTAHAHSFVLRSIIDSFSSGMYPWMCFTGRWSAFERIGFGVAPVLRKRRIACSQRSIGKFSRLLGFFVFTDSFADLHAGGVRRRPVSTWPRVFTFRFAFGRLLKRVRATDAHWFYGTFELFFNFKAPTTGTYV
jgi:hypothetical protein